MMKNLLRQRAQACLARNQFDEAVQWFRRAGDFEGAAEVLVRQGNYAEASTLYEQANHFGKAADAALQGQLFARAAGLFQKAGDVRGAAEALIRGGEIKAAIQLCESQSNLELAAELLEGAGRKKEAADLYLQQGNFSRAISLYRETGSLESLIRAYAKQGDPKTGAEECLQAGLPLAAAVLFEMAGEIVRAADLLRAEGKTDKALQLYERAGCHDRVAEIYMAAGQMDRAALAYALAPGKAVEAARIYERLVILNPKVRHRFEFPIVCGAVASGKDALALGTANRGVLYLSRGFAQKWASRGAGAGVPSSLAFSADGNVLVVGTEGAPGGTENCLVAMSAEKQVLWQKSFSDPVRGVVFLPTVSDLAVAVGDSIICFDVQGNRRWEQAVDFKAWCLAVSPEGDRLAVGTLGGSVYCFDAAGNVLMQCKMPERIHNLAFLPEGRAIVAAMGETALLLLDGSGAVRWQVNKAQVCRRILCLPGRNIIAAAGGKEISLLSAEGAWVYSFATDAEVQTLFADPIENLLYAATVEGEILGLESVDCRDKAAACYEEAGCLREAAELYEALGAHDKAYELFKEIGDYERAAKVKQLAGDEMAAARYYEVAGQHLTAARLYEKQGNLRMAALCYGRAGESEKAAHLYEQMNDWILAADFYDQAGHHKKAGQLFKKVGQIDRAVACFDQHCQSNPGDAEARFELGRMGFELGQYDKAIRELQMLTEDPTHRRESLKLLGECFVRKNLFDVAIDRLNEALGKDPKPSRDNIDIYYALGCAQESAGRFQEAKTVFSKIIAIDYYYRDIQERLKRAEHLSQQQSHGKIAHPSPVPAGPGTTVMLSPGEKSTERYQIIRKLGQGGMGVVYLALDKRLNRQVAWKVLPAQMAGKPDIQQRLLREARAAAQLSSKYIVSIYDIVTEPDSCFITMEYIEGTSLRKRMEETGPLPVGDVLRLSAQIAEALDVAHKAGVIHRDVKPENVMIDARTGDAKMVDFGLARLAGDIQLTQEGMIMGTAWYMSPEQIRAKPVDHRTDIYSFGVMLFEMLTGRPPFTGDNVFGQHLHHAAPLVSQIRPETPEVLVGIVQECLQKEPKDRPADCAQILARLRSAGPVAGV
ncbi:MAG: protein kinase [Candidatus Sumerlaeia bacterium]|nr:protein kinase [Candidatus Sumerlaeia bacterium]